MAIDVSEETPVEVAADRPLSSLRGFLKGTRTTGFREKKDRF